MKTIHIVYSPNRGKLNGRKWLWLIAGLLALALFLSACGPSASIPSTPTTTATSAPPTMTSAPTATAPPTPTPKPTGEPICLLTINGSDGQPVAQLCLTGEDVAFDANQNIVQGAGFVKVEPGRYYHVVPIFQCGENRQQLSIGMSWLEWDDNGKTLSIRGLEPMIDSTSGDKYEIASDLENPIVEDGLLKITIQDKGDFSFRIEFDGNGYRAHMREDGCPLYKELP